MARPVNQVVDSEAKPFAESIDGGTKTEAMVCKPFIKSKEQPSSQVVTLLRHSLAASSKITYTR